jgi:MFS transporter, DHA2 family, multidrug resistance protein
LRRPVFALSLATSIASFGAQALAIVSLPFYFEDRLGHSAPTSGLLLTPWPLATALIAPIAGRLADRFIPGLLGSIGLLVMGGGLALVALGIGDSTPVSLAWRLAICGLGFGFFQSPNNRVIIGSAPRERSGGAAGLQSSGRLIGQSFGTALVAVALGQAPRHATEIALWGAAALTLAGAITSGLRRAN